MTLIMGWSFNRLLKIKRLKQVNKISSKSRHGEGTDAYIKITKDKSIIFRHNKRKKLRKFMNKTSVSLLGHL